MAVQFNIPKQRKKSIDVIDNFLGADFTNSPAGMDKSKSPNLKNMIRDVPGKIRKCMGYESIVSFNPAPSTGYIFEDTSIQKTGLTLTVYQDNISCNYNSTEIIDVAIFFNESYYDFIESYMNIWGDSYHRFNAFALFDRDSWPNVMQFAYIQFYNNRYYIWIRFQGLTGQVTNYKPQFAFDATNSTVYGFFKPSKDITGIIHIGDALRWNESYTILYSGMNEHRSMGWEFDNALYIVDGKKFLSYSPTKNVSDTAYRRDKTHNEVVVNDYISMTIATFYNMDGVDIDSFITDSNNASVNVVDKGNGTFSVVYRDRLTTVGEEVFFNISYTPYASDVITEQYSTGVHYLTCISEYGTYEISPVEDKAYVPLITISKDPDGGGTSYNDLNLLSSAFTERFLPKKVNNTWLSDYQMSFDDLDEVEPIVKKLNDSTGEWETLTINVDYTVNYSTGIITFVTAPTRPDQSGEDRISITAYKTFPGYSDRINKCTIGTVFGVNGANDRLFLSGNPDYPNYDWYSGAYMLPEDEQDQESAQVNFTSPTYFPDTGYSTLGSTGSAIVGYSRVGNYLATHKDKYEKDQNIIIREGALEDSKPVFRVVNTLQGAPAIAPYSFEYLATEPIFLTEKGVYAITAYDITGEKYAQNRSFYLDGKLLKEANMDQAYSCVYNDMYWLCLNGVAYILDGLQPIRSDKSEPYATRQYVGFYRTNVPAYIMWENDGRLYFGTEDGKIMRFYNDKYDLESYNDDGEPIEAIWESGDLTGNVFFKNKTLNHIAVKLDSAVAASVTIEVMWRGLWNFVRTDHWRARQFQFSTEQFQYHTFSNDHTQRVIPKKVRFKNVDKFRLRLSNNELNESFALYDVGIEFTETDNYTR